VPVSGALIVTTPQDIALLDARRALRMFEKVEVPVLGIVENMAIHACSNCGHAEHIFGSGGGARMSEQYDVPLLGSLPLDIGIREQADGGTPTVASAPDSAIAAAYRDIARKAAGHLSLRGGGPPYYPMARAIVGGLAFSTVVTLLFLPTIYALLDDLRLATARVLTRLRETTTPASQQSGPEAAEQASL
jgi:hypothetical protein